MGDSELLVMCYLRTVPLVTLQSIDILSIKPRMSDSELLVRRNAHFQRLDTCMRKAPECGQIEC